MNDDSSANALPTAGLQRLSACPSDCVGLAQSMEETHLVALRPIAAHERLFAIEGETTGHPTRHSLQIGWQLHLEPDRGKGTAETCDHQFWRFLNHSCEPNIVIRGREVFARRAIAPGEAVTFDYNTTEWEMAVPFDCRCGSSACLGKIRGFKHLTAAQRIRLAPYLADHLRGHLPVGTSAPDVVVSP